MKFAGIIERDLHDFAHHGVRDINGEIPCIVSERCHEQSFDSPKLLLQHIKWEHVGTIRPNFELDATKEAKKSDTPTVGKPAEDATGLESETKCKQSTNHHFASILPSRAKVDHLAEHGG
jgi:hypothetical protein